MAQNTYVIAHPKLFLAVKGKLQKMTLGAEVTLDDKVAESLLKRGRIVEKETETVVVGGNLQKDLQNALKKNKAKK